MSELTPVAYNENIMNPDTGIHIPSIPKCSTDALNMFKVSIEHTRKTQDISPAFEAWLKEAEEACNESLLRRLINDTAMG